MKKTVSIISPAYNEEAVLALFCQSLISVINQIPKYTFEIIIVENGSTDGSIDVLLNERRKDKRIKIVQLVRNIGIDNGILAGLSYASGDAAIVMNADLQDDPKLITQFISKWKQGYDMVYAIIRSRKGISQAHQLLVRLLYKELHIVSMGRVPENVSDYRLLDRSLYSQILKRRHRNMFFRVAAALQSKNAIGIVYDRPERMRGTSKMTIAHYVADIRNAVITLFASVKPSTKISIAMRNDPLYVIKRRYGLSVK